SVDAPSSCTSTHYFSYDGGETAATATRCGVGTGKTPGATTVYAITLTYSTGAFGGSGGYY
ncbi:MAG: hypothetical protein WC469_05500, partial [Candidatus Omnitrophota bacterium]